MRKADFNASSFAEAAVDRKTPMRNDATKALSLN